MAKPPRSLDEPRRVESPVRVGVAGEVPAENGPLMGIDDRPAAPDVAMIPPLQSVPVDPGIVGMIESGQMEAPIRAPESPDPDRPWHPMERSLQDGTLLEGVAADGSEFHMIWRRTSRHNGFRWVPTGFWSNHLSREPLKVEPVGWRMPLGFVTPGMVVA